MAMLVVHLADSEDTERLGEDIALALRQGDLVTLSGDLGTGKSTLARGLIRTIADDDDHEVPSPTFTIVQSYPELRLPISHVDLYRIAFADEIHELGLDELREIGAVLVEWPENAGDALDEADIAIALRDSGTGREAVIGGSEAAMARLERSFAIRDFLRRNDRPSARRRYLLGDASARSYEKIYPADQQPLILMNSPYNPGGPVLRDGKTYMQIAHLSQSVHAFAGIDKLLAAQGFAVPPIIASDLDAGLLLIGDLGNEGILDDAGNPIAERYEAAARALARLHEHSWPHDIPVAPGVTHHIPPFDRDAMLIEVELLCDWYAPWRSAAPFPAHMIEDYRGVWNDIFNRLITAETSLLLRDVHSPNILWQPGERGIRRVGLIDFQDAMIGPSAYDVASLVFDARVTIPPELRRALLAAYVEERSAQGSFDTEAFFEAVAIMAAQRNAKILGIFVRLDRRDGKPAYLRHLPRIQAYLKEAMAHPALQPLKAWLESAGILDMEKSA